MKRMYEPDVSINNKVNNNFIFFFDDILENIFGFASIKQLLQYELISKHHCHFIRHCHFMTTPIILGDLLSIKYVVQVMNNHQFKNVDLSCVYVDNKTVSYFNQCKVINLCNTCVKDPLSLDGNYDYIRVDDIGGIYYYLINGNLFNKNIVNARDRYNNTLLIHCIDNMNNMAEVKYMLTLCGKYINVLNDHGKGVLYYALLRKDKELLSLLIQHGLNYHVKLPLKHEKIDVIQFCILMKEPSIAMMFMDCTLLQDNTLLVAMRYGYYDLVAILINKVNLNYIDKYGNNALYYAVNANNTHFTTLIINNVNVNVNNKNKLLLLAAKHKNKIMMNLVSNAFKPTKTNILDYYNAKDYYDRDIANYFVTLGEKVTLASLYNYFKHHEGSIEDWVYFQQFGFILDDIASDLLSFALSKNNQAWINYLVDHIKICKKQHVFQALVNNNVYCNTINLDMLSNMFAKSNNHVDYVIYAMKQKCSIDIIYLLLEYCTYLSNPEILYNTITYNSYYPIFNQVINLQHNIDVFMDAAFIAIMFNVINVLKIILKKLITKHVSINTIHNGYTLLIYAIINGKEDIIEYLIKKGANINFIPYLKPPIYYALQYGCLNTLVDAGADINTTYSYHDDVINLLLYAIMKGYKSYQLIIEGIDVNYVSKRGISAFTLLMKDYTNIQYILTLLETKGNRFLVEEDDWIKLLDELKENNMMMQHDDLLYLLS